MTAVLILPNQLFEKNRLITESRTVYLYEHPIYFTQYQYHKLKLILHRATMKQYQTYLTTKYNCKVTYIEYNANINIIFKNKVIMYDPVDHTIAKELKSYSKKYSSELIMYDTPLFICKLPDLEEYVKEYSDTKFNQTSFYIWQRKRLGILLDTNNKPQGGKWSFDKENRKKFNNKLDRTFPENNNKYIIEAKAYINKHFNTNFGNDIFYLPTDFESSRKHLKSFLKYLNNFGIYQDAIDKDIIFGCHSVLSPLINIGLITPQQVIDTVINYYTKNKKTIRLASVEGFIRQIIGWREYVRMIYIFKHKELVTINHLDHRRKLGKEWYTATTNMGPVDNVIKKVWKYGYAHHIERLMICGNFMLLNQTLPSDVLKWFMLFIDAYPWVMEPNVHGMSQYSVGNLMMTRLYFSSSNYIIKMSSYKKGDYTIHLNNTDYFWADIWDALYYNFINAHQQEFSKNYALASAVKHWKDKSLAEKKELIQLATSYMKTY